MLTLICGLPNAGKTTYSKKFEKVIHLDEEGRTQKVCDKVADMDEAVVEGIFITRKHRERLLAAYKGEYRKCIFLDITLEESIRREDRGRKPFILENAAKFFEPPTLDEGWDEIIIVRN